MRLTRQIIRDIEKEYGYPAKKTIVWFRQRPLRWNDIAVIFGCSRMTLRKICRLVGIENDGHKVLFRDVDRVQLIEDIIDCRHVKKMTVWEVAQELSISQSTVKKYTPEWLRGIQHLSQRGLEKKRKVIKQLHVANRKSHPWSL